MCPHNRARFITKLLLKGLMGNGVSPSMLGSLPLGREDRIVLDECPEEAQNQFHIAVQDGRRVDVHQRHALKMFRFLGLN